MVLEKKSLGLFTIVSAKMGGIKYNSFILCRDMLRRELAQVGHNVSKNVGWLIGDFTE